MSFGVTLLYLIVSCCDLFHVSAQRNNCVIRFYLCRISTIVKFYINYYALYLTLMTQTFLENYIMNVKSQKISQN